MATKLYTLLNSMIEKLNTANTNANNSVKNTDVIDIAHGGTGASDAATARTNLAITPANIGAATASHNQASTTITTGGSEGQICAVNSNGTISPNSRTIASLGTGANYTLSGTTLYINTI